MINLRHAMTISCVVARRNHHYLHAQSPTAVPDKSGSKDTQMLFIFNNKNSIQIAWGSKLSAYRPESRMRQLDTRFGNVGFIRTYSAG